MHILVGMIENMVHKDWGDSLHWGKVSTQAELGTARKELGSSALSISSSTSINRQWKRECRHTGSLGNPSHALASLVRKVIWDSLFQCYRAGQASWLKHTNHPGSVLMNEKQRWLFVPERDCGRWEGTGTSIHPGSHSTMGIMQLPGYFLSMHL